MEIVESYCHCSICKCSETQGVDFDSDSDENEEVFIEILEDQMLPRVIPSFRRTEERIRRMQNCKQLELLEKVSPKSRAIKKHTGGSLQNFPLEEIASPEGTNI